MKKLLLLLGIAAGCISLQSCICHDFYGHGPYSDGYYYRQGPPPPPPSPAPSPRAGRGGAYRW